MAKGSGTLIIGNGDAKDLDDARQKVRDTGADGIMLGRAIFGNPWLFSNLRNQEVAPVVLPEITLQQRLCVMIEHTELFEELLGDIKNFATMKKHFKAYVNGFDGAKELRVKLMETDNSTEVKAIVRDFFDARVTLP